MRALCAILLLFGVASADTYSFPPLRTGKGYAGPVTIDVTWASTGLARDCAAVTGTVRAYTAAGALLWTKSATPVGVPTNRLSFTVTAADTAAPGSYYLELDLTEGEVVDATHSTLVIEGK